MKKFYTNGRNDMAYFPALAVPIEGKDEFFCSVERMDEIRSFIETCEDFLIIGFGGLDTHVVDLFQGVDNLERLDVVSKPKKAGILTVQKFAQRCKSFENAYVSARSDPAMGRWAPFGGGFANYVDSGALASFLDRK